jgi:hypothetical protein
MKVVAYKCPYTGKLFDETDKKSYLACVRHNRSIINEEKKFATIRSDFEAWLAAEKLTVKHVNEIGPWFLKNQQRIMDATNTIIFGHYNKNDQTRFLPTDEFTKISINAQYNPSVSNTHHCPKGGVTNWGSKANLPAGYKGWRGRISGTLIRDPKNNGWYPYDSALRLVHIHTGSGGGGNVGWGYELYIFLDDWPGLQDTIDKMEQDQIVAKLKGIK